MIEFQIIMFWSSAKLNLVVSHWFRGASVGFHTTAGGRQGEGKGSLTTNT